MRLLRHGRRELAQPSVHSAHASRAIRPNEGCPATLRGLAPTRPPDRARCAGVDGSGPGSRSDHAAVRGACRDAMHGPVGRPRHRHLVLRRRGAGRDRRRPGRRGRAAARARVRAGSGRHRRRPGLLGLADHLQRAQRRGHLGGDRRVRQQGRLGHPDRGDTRGPAERRQHGPQSPAPAARRPPAGRPAHRVRPFSEDTPPARPRRGARRPHGARGPARPAWRVRGPEPGPGRSGCRVFVHRGRLDRRGRHGRVPGR